MALDSVLGERVRREQVQQVRELQAPAGPQPEPGKPVKEQPLWEKLARLGWE
jgi:hypothetical protein